MDIQSNPPISITGIGVPLLPNSLLDVKIFTQLLYVNNQQPVLYRAPEKELIYEGRLIQSGKKDTDIEPINFQKPVKVENTYNDFHKITIEIKGRGEFRFGCRKLIPPFEKDKWITSNMNYSRKNGLVKNIEVSIRTEDKGILAELYIKPLDKENL